VILYNITVAVDDAIHDEWLEWMTQEHIPEVMATNKFMRWKMYKVLLDKEDGVTYSIQYFAENMADLQLYQALHANDLQARQQEKFSDQALAFSTILEEV